ncbi:hypothetical protein D3C78_1994210 [compost metagenome]
MRGTGTPRMPFTLPSYDVDTTPIAGRYEVGRQKEANKVVRTDDSAGRNFRQ